MAWFWYIQFMYEGASSLGLLMAFLCLILMFYGNDQEVIAIQTLCLSSFEVQLNFNTS